MLLAIDCGNTQLVAGVFEGERLLASWRLQTVRDRTEDEYAALFMSLFSARGWEFKPGIELAACSVVPQLNQNLQRLAEKYLLTAPLFIDYQTSGGMEILSDDPRELGADRIANSCAGFRLYGGPLIVIDFGTATNFDCISETGAYLGGAIAPGIQISCEALFARAARLSNISIHKPERALGTNTADCLRSGIVWGFAGQVDGIAAKLREELPGARVIATGGLADRIAPHSKTIELVNKDLTLQGLQMLYAANRPQVRQ